MKHTKLNAALVRYGEDQFRKDAEAMLADYPKCRIVLGLLGGASVARNINGMANWNHTAGRNYPRTAVRYIRGIGIVGISKHSGPYLYITL